MAFGLGNISGTMEGMDVQTLLQALQQQQAEELASHTQQATQAATQAGQDYQGAASQPAPELGMLAQLAPTLLGNVASVISGNPDYAQQGQQSVKQGRSELLRNRADNLKALQDVFSQKAEAAQKAGDFEAEEKARIKRESISKTYDLVEQNYKQVFDREEKQKDRDAEMERARLKEEGDSGRARNQERNQARADTRIRNAEIGRLTSAVRNDPDVKQFVTIRDQLSMGIGGAAQKSNLGDVLLMRSIARASDPLSSVREEEFRTFKGAQGAMAQIGINLTKEMWGKGMLNEFGRVQMTDALQNIYNTKKVQHDRALAQFRYQGDLSGIEPEAYMRDYTIGDIGGNPKAKSEAMATARKGDIAAFRAMIEANPALKNDPDIVAQAKRLVSKK